MFSHFSSGLRFRLMLLVVLALSPMLGLLLYHAGIDRERKLQDLQNEAVRVAELSAGSVTQIVEGTRHMLHAMAFTESVRTMNGPEACTLFSDLLAHSSFYNNIGLTRSNGEPIASAVEMKEPLNLSKRSWFSRLQERRDFSIGNYQIGVITKLPTLVLSYPVPGQPADQPLVAIYAALNLASLQSCISGHGLIPQSTVAVLDRNGIEVACTPFRAQEIGKQAKSWRPFLAGGSQPGKFSEITSADGIPRLYCHTPVPASDEGLFVAVGVAKDELLAAVRADFLHNLCWLGICTLAALIGAWFFADATVIRQVRRLTHAARQLASGEWNIQARQQGGAWELHQLAEAFDDMAATLSEHHNRLEEKVGQRTAQLIRTNEFLREEIEERKQAEAEAKKLLAELERSNKELEQFAYVASHDLQEPLRLVSAYSQLLLQRYRDRLDAGADPIVQFITEGVTRMQQLIQDLLAYSRVSSEHKPLCLADTGESLAAALRNLSVTIGEHQAEVTHDPLPTLHCNPAQLTHLSSKT